jgi:hypothetical protein
LNENTNTFIYFGRYFSEDFLSCSCRFFYYFFFFAGKMTNNSIAGFEFRKMILVLGMLLGCFGNWFVSAVDANLVPTSSPTAIISYSNIVGLSNTYAYNHGTVDMASSIVINVRLQTSQPEALVYCGVFANANSDSSDVPATYKSTADIFKQGFYAYSTSHLANVLVTGMTASSKYWAYCATVSTQNNAISMPYSATLTQRSLIATLCCKIVSFQTSISSMFTGKSSLTSNPNAITLTLNAAPSSSALTINLVLYSVSNSSTPVSKLGSLSTTQIVVPTTYTPNTPYSIVLSAGTPGKYRINATMSGRALDEYDLAYVGSRTITVLSTFAQPIPPNLLSAMFSVDGTYVLLAFDSPTSGTNNFACGSLLSFAGSSAATCTWVDSQHIAIYPTYSAAASTNVLAVNSEIILSAGVVKAYCTDPVTKCSDWGSSPAATVHVAVNPKATLPTITISGPSTVGPCINIALDMSNSQGAAGRPWNSYNVTVYELNNLPASNITGINAFLQNHTLYTISPPTPIPYKSLVQGRSYVFKAVFCNFLGACNFATKTVAVTNEAATPIVSILGASSRTMITGTQLLVQADAYTKSCVGGQSALNLK